MTDVFTGLTTDGVVTLAAPRFVPNLGVELTTVPGGVAIMSGFGPRRLMKAGWVALERAGSDAGWPTTVFADAARWISFEREQMSYGAPGVFADRVRYHLEPGVVASVFVNDALAPAGGSAPMEPWDRNPSAVGASMAAVIGGGTAFATWFTYTVPSGRKLLLSKMNTSVQRLTAATTSSTAEVTISLAGTVMARAMHFSNVIGLESRDDLEAGAVVLVAGQTVVGTYQDVSTGGSVMIRGSWVGYLFDE